MAATNAVTQPDLEIMSPRLDAALEAFDGLSVEEKAGFGLRRCSTLMQAITRKFPIHDEPEASRLEIVLSGPSHARHCRLDGYRLKNSDILELQIGIPDWWLPVWIEGLPNRALACLVLGNLGVGRIELHEGVPLRWPKRRLTALETFVEQRFRPGM